MTMMMIMTMVTGDGAKPRACDLGSRQDREDPGFPRRSQVWTFFFFFNLILIYFNCPIQGSTLGRAGTWVGTLVGWTEQERRFRSGSKCSTDQTSGSRVASDSDQAWTLGLSSENFLHLHWPLQVTSTCCCAPTPPSLPSTTFSYQSRCLWVHYLWYGHKYPISCDIDMSVTETTIFCT